MTTDQPEACEQPDKTPDDDLDPTETLGGGAGRSHGRSKLTPDQMRPPPQAAMEEPPAPVPPAEGDTTTDPGTDD